jgi:hypothetical protein
MRKNLLIYLSFWWALPFCHFSLERSPLFLSLSEIRQPFWLSCSSRPRARCCLTRGDYWHGAAWRPRRISIAGSDIDDHLPCNWICQDLLFNHQVESVQMVKFSPVQPGDTSNNRDLSAGLTYVIERRESCPPANLSNLSIAKARQQIAAGECLIGRAENEPRADTLLVRKVFFRGNESRAPANITVPWFVTLGALGVLTIEQRREDGGIEPVLRQTFAEIETIAIPFILNFAPPPPGVVADGPSIARRPFFINQAWFDNIHVVLQSLTNART